MKNVGALASERSYAAFLEPTFTSCDLRMVGPLVRPGLQQGTYWILRLRRSERWCRQAGEYRGAAMARSARDVHATLIDVLRQALSCDHATAAAG